MEEKRPIDLFGASALIAFAALLAFNQVVIKVTSDGISPAFQAGIRSLGAIILLFAWMKWRGIAMACPQHAIKWGVLSGLLFAVEFLMLFTALDLTTVSRASVIFYTMPVWLAIAAHVLLPGEKLSGLRLVGMALAVGGIILALSDRSNGEASLAGDILALCSSFGWAAIALLVRATSLSQVKPIIQLFFQVTISAPILLLAAPLFGPLLRDLEPIHFAAMGFQIIAVVCLGFLAWFWLLTIYRAASVASFSFLSPVLAVFFGWALLDEKIGPAVLGALVMVTAGLYLINRK